MQIEKTIIFRPSIGAPIYRFRLVNSAGAYVDLTNWGARWLAAMVPDRNNRLENVLLTPADPMSDEFYMGAIVGRFANRIAHACIEVEGRQYRLEQNDGENSNHGGFSGFHQKNWDWELLSDGVRFTLLSPDGDGGYPGAVKVAVEYRWNDRNELSVDYVGVTDKPTYLNLTNHAYFNLGGKEKPIWEHELFIPAHYILETTKQFIPTGNRVAVEGTPFDFTQAKLMGRDINADDEQLRWNRGYNHCYVLKEEKNTDWLVAARLFDPASGRMLVVETDLPAVLLYTAGYYKNPDTAVCLEVQYFPDTPGHIDFPSCLLRPGEEYRQRATYRFAVDKGY